MGPGAAESYCGEALFHGCAFCTLQLGKGEDAVQGRRGRGTLSLCKLQGVEEEEGKRDLARQCQGLPWPNKMM